MLYRRLIPLLAALMAALPASAQFHTLGEDPGGIRWNTIETPTYRVIYPRGLDSLGRAYASALERAAGTVGATVGARPNAAYKNRMPVVLHPFTAYSNGQVTWTPRRMELFTTPDAFPDEANPWMTQLAIHESRHVSQMQGVAGKPFRWLNVLTGQGATGLLAAVYGGPAFFEGDAVAAETALTRSGRGRTASFLEYYRVSFAAGDFRDYWRWRYGSQRYYTPDYYRAGYLAVAGIRAHFNVPDLSARFYQRIADHGGVAFFNWQKTVREATGLSFKDAFAEVCTGLQKQWAADEAKRGPFLQTELVSRVPRRFTEYEELETVNGELYAIRSGITKPTSYVKIGPDGRETSCFLLGSTSPLKYSEPAGRFFWSEIVRDPRWPLRSYSVIRYSDSRTARTLTHKTRYFNPTPAPDEQLLSATEYLLDGTSRVVVLDARDGSVRKSWNAPAGMQVLETAWVDGTLYANAITTHGYGIYRLPDFTLVLGPRAVKMEDLWDHNGRLMFVSDLSGVDELYAYDPKDGYARQLTNTRFGASSFLPMGDSLYFSVLQPEGRLIHKVAWKKLRPKLADFSTLPDFPFAKALAAGEPQTPVEPFRISKPKPYNKLAHLFRFHTWLPAYVDYDGIEELSLSRLTEDVGLGATAFWQNDLGTSYGSAGYHAAYEEGAWRHSLHGKWTYSGLYPVFEASVDFNDRDARTYFLQKDEEKQLVALKARPRENAAGTGVLPSLSASLRTYIPWNFSSGGSLRGVVPSATLSLSNDRFQDGQPLYRSVVSLRAYDMERTPDSRVYPRLGIGAEVGYSFRWTKDLFAPSAYAYLYGYLPGLHETHGLRLSALGTKRFEGLFSEAYANIAPRGYGSAVLNRLAGYEKAVKGAVDYKMPLLPLDFALGPVAYLRNFELTLHADYTAFASPQSAGSLYSAGADLALVLGNLAWIPYPTRVGVSYNYNGGASYADFVAQGLPLERHVFSLILSVEM